MMQTAVREMVREAKCGSSAGCSGFLNFLSEWEGFAKLHFLAKDSD
jgi:hypothetical protein